MKVSPFVLSLSFLAVLYGQPDARPKPARKVDVNAVIKEVMKLNINSKNDNNDSAFWVPYEFFEALDEINATPEAHAEAVKGLSILKEYQIFLVRRSYKDDQGLTRVISNEDLSRRIALLSPDNKEILPLRDLPSKISNIVGEFKKGVEANSQGIIYSTFVFPNTTKTGTFVIQPSKRGKVVLFLKAITPVEDYKFTWTTPLDSLSTPNKCQKCSEILSSAWNFCPWDGQIVSDASK